MFVVIFNLQKLGDIPDGLSTKGRSQVKATDATIDIRGPEKLVSLQRVAHLDFILCNILNRELETSQSRIEGYTGKRRKLVNKVGLVRLSDPTVL